jgi:adenylate cyclase
VPHSSHVERSEEIRRVVERWEKAIAAGDDETILSRLSDDPGTLMIGTDPAEWWHGAETRLIWGRQLQEMGPFPVTATEIEAWEEGSVGWASVKERIDLEGGALDSRATYILHLERGEWKVVHVHWSFPRSNEETLGRSLTVTFDELGQTVRREQPDLPASLAVDGTVTIVFTDIVDSTVMLARLGDRAWMELIRRHNRVIRETTETHGGTVVETQGDGSMLAFPSARRAVACAAAIQLAIAAELADVSPPVRIRIGIHTGDTIKGADAFFGTTVHYAARVAGHAVGGEVLVSSTVRDLVQSGPSGVTFLDGREVELKGIEGRHRLYALSASSSESQPSR